MFHKEKLYLAGPECFYTGGFEKLDAMKRYAKVRGFGVTLPNDHPLDMNNRDLQKRADSIFADLKRAMKETTIIVADLESFRGPEPDSGTIYEIGMAYADGLRCYGYTRDKRPLFWKDQKFDLINGRVCNEKKRLSPYKDLPFAPSVVGSTKIVEGTFEDCMGMIQVDLEEAWKLKGFRMAAPVNSLPVNPLEGMAQSGIGKRPVIYLSDLVRYGSDAFKEYKKRKQLCNAYGLDVIAPLGWNTEEVWLNNLNFYTASAFQTEHNLQLIRNCDAVLADLNNYRGYECANDVGFECGAGFSLGKKLFGYMDDIRPCVEKIPHLGENAGFRDMTGSNVENFNYPINLMFASSMEIYQGKFEHVIKRIAEALID